MALATLIKDCDTKASEMLSFLPLKNNSVKVGSSILLASISAIISSNTINNFYFFDGL